MLGTTVIGGTPSGVPCMDWSHEGILAIATGETVDFLIPDLDTSDRQNLRQQKEWERVKIQTNLWTVKELPYKIPAPSRIYSVAEEISLSLAAAVRWSPPGLAKHQRSALAVFTSNLVLSIWACTGNPKNGSNWKRELIINNTLKQYFGSLNDAGGGGDEQSVRKRLRLRLRAFTWCPTIGSKASGPAANSRGASWKAYLLAVYNDNHEVIILQVHSPYEQAESTSQNWTATVLCHFSTLDTPLEERSSLFQYGDHLKKNGHVQQIAWSPLRLADDGSVVGFLAFTTTQKILIKHVKFAKKVDGKLELSLDDKDIFKHDMGDQPPTLLEWFPKIDGLGRLHLISFSMDEVECFTLTDLDGSSKIEYSQRDLAGRWDPVNGVAFSLESNDKPRIHFTTHISTQKAPGTELELPLVPENYLPNPIWQTQLIENQAFFNTKLGFNDKYTTKTWGITHSPLGDVVAYATSFHPTDQVEYMIAADTTFTLATTETGSGADISIPEHGGICYPEEISSEAVAFSVKRWCTRLASQAKDSEHVEKEIFNGLLNLFGMDPSRTQQTPEKPSRPLVPEDGDLDQVAQKLWDSFLDRDTVTARLQYLVSFVCNSKTVSWTQSKQLIVSQLVKTALVLSNQRGIIQDGITKKILAIYSMLRDDVPMQNGLDAAEPPEQCELCDAPIWFQNQNEAYCDEGHQFARCGLTFLAIQEPGICRSCGICGMQSLNPDYVLGQDNVSENADGEVAEGSSASKSGFTLAQILYTACDACVYCGGKFVS